MNLKWIIENSFEKVTHCLKHQQQRRGLIKQPTHGHRKNDNLFLPFVMILCIGK